MNLFFDIKAGFMNLDFDIKSAGFTSLRQQYDIFRKMFGDKSIINKWLTSK